MWPPLMNRFAKLNFFFSSWMPLKGVLAKLSYCSHERQRGLLVQIHSGKAMVHPKAKATIPPFVVSLREMLAISTLATKQEQFPRQWWYIVAVEQDVLLCCRKRMNGSLSPATVWRLKFKSNATFKQMSVQEIKTVLSMPGIKQNTQFDIWKWFSLPLTPFHIKLTWQSSQKKRKKNSHKPTSHK